MLVCGHEYIEVKGNLSLNNAVFPFVADCGKAGDRSAESKTNTYLDMIIVS